MTNIFSCNGNNKLKNSQSFQLSSILLMTNIRIMMCICFVHKKNYILEIIVCLFFFTDVYNSKNILIEYEIFKIVSL